MTSFDLDPDRVAMFVARFLAQHGLEIVAKKENSTMSKTANSAGATALEAAPQAPAAEKPARTGKDYIKKFGTDGAIWFAEGKTWAQAQALHRKKLKKQVDELEAKNAELNKALGAKRGEATPLSFNGEQSPAEALESNAQARYRNKLSPALARFATGIQIPSPKPSRN